MKKCTLIVFNNELLLKSDNDVYHKISAKNIYNYHFKGENVIDGKFIIIEDKTQSLEYSKFPLLFNLKLFIEKGEIRLSAFSDNPYHVIQNGILKVLEKSDHIIADGKWYPFAKNELSSIRDLLFKCNVTELGSINISQYLKIKNDKNLAPKIIDQISIEDMYS